MPGHKFTFGLFAVYLIAAAQCQNAGCDQAAPPSTAPAWKVGLFEVHVTLDAYYSVGFNQPTDHLSLLRGFDVEANRLDLNAAKLTLDRVAAPVGFHVDVGAGRMFDVTGASEKNVRSARYIEQAYLSIKPESWHGIQVDAGKFASSAGAEVLDTAGNWNYSRSFLFAWAIPYYHTGLRGIIPLGGHFVAGLQWVSGWNNVVSGATYRTVGMNSSWSHSKLTWSQAYYRGPDENKSDRGLRNLYDTTLLFTPNGRVSFYINGDYGHDQPRVGRSFEWSGVAGAGRFQLAKRFSVSSRLEILHDGSGEITGARQTLKEGTLTGAYRIARGLSHYVEFRDDWSGAACLGNCSQDKRWKSQPTLLVGLVWIVGSHR